MKPAHRTLLTIAAICFLAGSARSQMPAPEDIVTIQADTPVKLAAGESAQIELPLAIKAGWHINAEKPLDPYLIPTVLRMRFPDGIRSAAVEYPAAKLASFSFSEEKLAVYEGAIRLRMRLNIASDFPPGPVELAGEFQYQACNDVACLAPVTKALTMQAVVEAGTAFGGLTGSAQGLGLMGSEPGGSNTPPTLPKITTDVLFSLNRAEPGGMLNAAIRVNIDQGWHINAHRPLDPTLIPTTIELRTSPDVKFDEAVYPEPEEYSFSFSDEKLAVYSGGALIGVPVTLSRQFSDDSLIIEGTLRYQACNDNACLLPAEAPIRGAVATVSHGDAVALVNEAVFSRIAFAVPVEAAGGEIGSLIAEKGLGLTFILIFLGGLALNLTPCVYPLIPITVSFFGGQAAGRPSKMFGLAVVYLLGMALTYSLLGLAAALSGAIFGAMLQNPFVLVGIAAVLVLLSLSMFGVWELRMPQKLNQIAGGSKQGYLGALFMGLTVGIVAAPCIGPFVLGLLTYVGAVGDPLLGFAMFFTLAVGLGLPYVILGTFSGMMQSLPRSGTWMIWVKKVFGFILLAMAAYFLQPILPEWAKTAIVPAILLTGGVVVGFLDRTSSPGRYFPLMKKLAGAALVAAAAWWAWPAPTGPQDAWQPYTEDLVIAAREEGRPVIIDFTAEWCAACKELEHQTFPHPEVVKRSTPFLLLRADLTKFSSPPVQALKEKYEIRGLPTVIFLDPAGVERKNLRVIGFIDGNEFAKRMDALLAPS